MPGWLKDAVFYEIYPQSFYDTNGDGIGDFEGIIRKLDYVKSLGCNALWINPCFDSPFMDAGYDVRDYYKVASRYGTNEDLYRLFSEAHERGIHVLLDLVPGHTSEEHEWFRASSSAGSSPYDDRYVWTDSAFRGIPEHPYIGGMRERDGCYMLNFFASQPALNYGWARCTEDWMLPPEHPACQATVQAMLDVMRFWLDHGCDGFRVDMADSLVKNDDDEKSATGAIWRRARAMLDNDYPEAALVSEWGHPELALKYGFHMDFYLDHWGNGYNLLLREFESHISDGTDRSFFKKDSGGDITGFVRDYEERYLASRDKGYISFITCNHDTPRARRTLSERELALAYSFIFTMPGVPFMYYGDEIGMRYLKLTSKEGGYARTGTRTPMQWEEGAPNLGFSEAPVNALYLPVDPAGDAPTVSAQERDQTSLLNTVKKVIGLRHSHEELQADAPYRTIVAGAGSPYVYGRGSMVCAVNPSGSKEQATLQEKDRSAGLSAAPLYLIGDASYDAATGTLSLGAQSFAVWRGIAEV